jgi:hypothetical protein
MRREREREREKRRMQRRMKGKDESRRENKERAERQRRERQDERKETRAMRDDGAIYTLRACPATRCTSTRMIVFSLFYSISILRDCLN